MRGNSHVRCGSGENLEIISKSYLLTFMLHRFDTLLAQMITPVVPTVVAAGYENLYDVTQVGWGKCRPAY